MPALEAEQSPTSDDIDGSTGEEEKLTNLVELREKAFTAYGMDIKPITNNTSDINTEIKVNGQKLKTVRSLRYLGSVITDEGSKPKYSPG